MAATIQHIELPKKPRAKDTSGNNNHGETYSGRALEFDGVTDYLNVGSNVTVSTGAWTVAAWVNISTLPGDTQDNVSSTSSAVSSRFIGVRTTGTAAIWDYNSGWRETSTALNLNTWYRVLWVYDGANEVTIYLNGVADGTGVLSSSSSYDHLKVEYIGAIHGSPAIRHWDGKLSDYQAWDAAFTAADAAYDFANPESLALNASGTALTEANLKLWYPMQDGHRGQQSYILDGANTGALIEEIDITAGTAYGSWANGTQNSATWSGGGSGVQYYDNVATGMVSGKTYTLSFTVSGYQGTSNLGFSGTGGTGTPNLSGNGTKTVVFVSDGNDLKLYSRDTITNAVVSNVSVKAINDKHHATTVFLGDELITDTNDRTFAGASHWLGANVNGSNTNNDFVTYNENYTGTGYSGGALQLVSDDDASNVQFAILDGAEGNGWETNMVEGRTYRLSFQAAIFRTSGTLSVGFANASHALSSDIRAFTATVDDDAVYTLDFVYNATNHAELIVHTAVSSQWIAFLDDISIKEVGVASGWTDADQQLHIPQPALQSYNELAWATDADEQVEIADHNDFSFDTDNNDDPFSLSAWVYVADFTGSFFVFTKGGYSSSRHQLEYKLQINSSGTVYLYLHDGPTTDGGSSNHQAYARWFTATNTIKKGKWYNIVTTYSGTTPSGTSDTNGKIYVDGVEVSTTSSQANYARMSNQGHSLMMHKAGTSGSFGAPGSMTEAAVWNKALSAAEVIELYNDGKALEASAHSAYGDVLGYWRNNGLSTWTNIKNPGTHDGVVTDFTETLLIPQGVDGSRDTQGFIMNKQRNTSSLNFPSRPQSSTEVPDFGDLDFGTGDFSMECWVQYGFIDNSAFGETASGLNVVLSTGSASSTDTEGINLFSTGSMFKFRIGDGDKEDSLNIDPDPPTVGNWYHIVVTREGTALIAYVDGDANSNMTITSGINVSRSEPLRIGNDRGGNRTYKWPIDSVKFYNKALDSTEVKRNYKATKGSHRN